MLVVVIVPEPDNDNDCAGRGTAARDSVPAPEKDVDWTGRGTPAVASVPAPERESDPPPASCPVVVPNDSPELMLAGDAVIRDAAVFSRTRSQSVPPAAFVPVFVYVDPVEVEVDAPLVGSTHFAV
jgi:hypothetical protein